MDISFRLNGECVSLTGVDPTRSVLDYLREDRGGLTGTKEGCNEGDCGACSIMVGGDTGGIRAQNACLMMLGHIDGKALVTVEGGLAGADGTPPHPCSRPWWIITARNAASVRRASQRPWRWGGI